MDTDGAYKNKIGERLTRVLATALYEGKVSEEEGREIAGYILENIDKAENSPQVVDFLTEIVHKWEIFGQILTVELQEISDEKKDEVVENAGKLIQENKVEEALKAIESAVSENNPVKGEQP